MSEDELDELAVDFGDLTETAKQALRSEMRSRGLDDPAAPTISVKPPIPLSNGSASVAPESEAEDNDASRDYTWKTVLCECSDYKEAWRIHAALARAGIESWIERQGSKYPTPWVGEFMTGELQILVAADQLNQARAIAARPIPQDIVDESNTEVPEFVEPKCPMCGSDDVVLEGVDTENRWRCELCDAEWTDAATDAGPQGGTTADSAS